MTPSRDCRECGISQEALRRERTPRDEDKGDQHQRINGTGWGWGSVHSDGTKPAFSPKSPGSALGMKRLLGYASGFSGTRGPWHEGHDASSAEGGIRGTGRSHREDSEQGLATTFTMKLGRVHRAPPRWLVAEATDRVTGSPASPPTCPVSDCAG